MEKIFATDTLVPAPKDGADGKPGQDGKPGSTGPMLYPAGRFEDLQQVYVRTQLTVPFVEYEGQYYVLNKEGETSGINPRDDYAAHGKNATWVLMDKMKYAFIEALVADFGKIASAVFWREFMFSQHGKDANGADTQAYEQFGKKDDYGNDLFKPNILIDWLKGKVTGLDMDIKGGRIGAFEVRHEQNLHNADGRDCWISIERTCTDGVSKRVSSLGNNVPGFAGFDVAGDFEATGPQENIALRLKAQGVSPEGIRRNFALYAVGGVNWSKEEDDYWSMPGLLAVIHYNLYYDGAKAHLVYGCDWGNGVPFLNAEQTGFNMEHRIGTVRFSSPKKGFFSVIAQKVGPSWNNHWSANWNTNVVIESQDANGFTFSCWYNQDKYYPGNVNFFLFGNPG